jgi:thioredoxin-related protein
MKYLILILAASVSANVLAQEKGIHFEQDVNWESLLAKAKSSNKYIFVDCYTSWCGPCKQMDKNTYQDEKLGEYVNDNFISVKLQMDTAKADDENIIRGYALASQFSRSYQIDAYPSYLFFSPNGQIVHRYLGYLTPNDFLSIAKEALDTNRQYYVLLDKYRRKVLDYSLMPYFSIKANLIGEKKLSDSVVENYMNNYLYQLDRKSLFTWENLVLMEQYTKLPADRSFSFFRENIGKIDSILGERRGEKMLIKTIINGEIMPLVKNRHLTGPEWQILEKKFNRRYGKTGRLAVLQQRLLMNWASRSNWEAFGKSYVLYFQNIGSLNTVHVNNASWDIFLHVTDPKIISFAIDVMEPHKEEDLQSMDTYASLLYKAGKVEKAISIERKAAYLQQEYASKNHLPVDKTYEDNVEKMKERKRFWMN